MSGVFTRYLTEAEEKALFKSVNDTSGVLAERDHAWMRLLRATGIRVGALSRLTVGHARGFLRTGYVDLEPGIQKCGVAHRLLATRKCQKALRDLLRIRREMGHPERDDAPLIMSRQQGRGLSVRSFQTRMKMWSRKGGLSQEATPHWFRHTVGKRIMKSSTAADPRGVAQGVLGHKSIKNTAIYTQPDKEDIEEAMREVC